MMNNNIKLMENMPQKVEGWKITKDKKDMENYFREIFVGDIFFDRWLDRFLTRMLDLILEDDFDLDEFIKMNTKYPNSQFHDYIVSRKKNYEMKELRKKNYENNRNNRKKVKETTVEDIIQDLVRLDLEQRIEELIEDLREINDYTEEEIDRMYVDFRKDPEWVLEMSGLPIEN